MGQPARYRYDLSIEIELGKGRKLSPTPDLSEIYAQGLGHKLDVTRMRDDEDGIPR